MNINIVTDPMQVFGDRAPRRVVSLVPSITASLLDFGLGGALLGATDFCPAGAFARVGGPKTLDVPAVLALKPELVLANQEENDRVAVEGLAEAGIPVWLAFPQSVRDAIQDLWTLAKLFRSQAAMRQVDVLERSLELTEVAGSPQADLPAVRCFCPIWESEGGEEGQRFGTPRWWMTFNDKTYPSDVLHVCGAVNVFGQRMRRYPLAADLGMGEPAENPGERDTRYPRVTIAEVLAAQPDVILLPDEPYPYREDHAAAVARLLHDTPAGRSGRVYLIDGTLLMWHGTRLARALDELPHLFDLSS
jgi:ABC-type Fe3+-hydroxamate transport system substrate-binding protein